MTITKKASIFSLMASLTTGVQQHILGLLPWQVSTAFCSMSPVLLSSGPFKGGSEICLSLKFLPNSPKQHDFN